MCRFRGDRDAFGLARVPIELDDSDDGEGDDFGPRAGRSRRDRVNVSASPDGSDSENDESNNNKKKKKKSSSGRATGGGGDWIKSK